MSDLDARLLAAHAAGDAGALVSLYSEAADRTGIGADAAAFYLTQAYVFALDTGHPDRDRLKARLVAAGRDTAD